MMTSQSIVIFPDAFLILQLSFIEGPEIFWETEVKSYLFLGELIQIVQQTVILCA